MSYKSLSENKVIEMRSTEAIEPITQETSEIRYKHTYFIESDPANPLVQDYLIFTIKVNFLPSKPVYIDIANLRDLIYSMTSNSKSSETVKFKNELLDLLKHYAKIS